MIKSPQRSVSAFLKITTSLREQRGLAFTETRGDPFGTEANLGVSRLWERAVLGNFRQP